MVPLSGQSEGTYDDGRKRGSSTEFFAIPHANRAKAGANAAPQGYAPVQPVAHGAVAPMGGPVPMGPVPVGGIQGPVAAGPMGAGAGGPYGVVDPNLDDGRSQSYRVFGVVIVLVMMVCMALLVTVGLVVVAVVNKTPPEEVVKVDNPPIVPRNDPERDTGGALEKAVVAPPPKPPKKVVKNTTGPKAPPKPKPVADAEPNGGGPAGEPGTVTVRKPAGIFVSHFEISCPSANAWRARGKFVNDVATIANVPASECTGRFKGGGVTSKVMIRSGSANLNCTAMNSATLNCK